MIACIVRFKMYHKISVFSSIGQTHSEKENGLNNNYLNMKRFYCAQKLYHT